MKIKFYKYIIATLITSIMLSGCGFKLRSAKSLLPQPKEVYFQTENPFGKLELNFKRKLKSSITTLLTKPKKTSPIINLSSSFSYNDRSPASTTQARVYNLNYTATISITDFYNKQLLPPQTITTSRSISLQPNEVFENTPQVEIAKQEMVQELTNRILNILASPKTAQALNNLAP